MLIINPIISKKDQLATTFMLTFCFPGSVFSKILVASGLTRRDGDATTTVEIVDLSTTLPTWCEPLQDFPVNVSRPFGGLAFESLPVVCGGKLSDGES